jgi:anthranilate 1,2-dioxygenase small subunit
METSEARRTIDELHTRYIRVIDDEQWEEWPGLFTESCLYKIVTRENFAQGLPLAVMECNSRGMLQDRVTGLRTINVYEPHRYLHLTSALAIENIDGNVARCRSNYLVVRTMLDGTMSIFSAGMYLDKVLLGPGEPQFQERVVVADSRRIGTLLVFPL